MHEPPRTPTSHKSSHQDGGSDEISVAGLSGVLADNQKIAVLKGGVAVGSRAALNLIEGTNITLTVADNGTDGRVDVTVTSTGTPTANTTLQDAYDNGTTGDIEVVDEKPFTVSGPDGVLLSVDYEATGSVTTLDVNVTNMTLTSGCLVIDGAGADATISSTGDLSFEDENLSAPIPLSETGEAALSGFTAVSIVGALNELKAGGSGGTDIAEGTRTSTSVQITSSTGADATLSAASTTLAGVMVAADKTKLDGLSNYTHPTGDGNLHVPATSTTNSGKVLTAGATAGSLSWTVHSLQAAYDIGTTGGIAVLNGKDFVVSSAPTLADLLTVRYILGSNSTAVTISSDATTIGGSGGSLVLSSGATLSGVYDLTFDDQYLTSPIALSQTGTTGLSGFTATSIVAALNELKSGKEASITKATGYLTWSGSAWAFLNETYSLSSHTHSYAGSSVAGGAANSVANALTFSTGITVSSGTDYNGSAARTISVAYGSTGSTACAGNDSRLSDARTPTAHNLIDTTGHPVTGLSTGHFLKATGATTYGFAAHGLTYTDVSAAPSTHVGATGAAHGDATTSVAGFQSAADKTKLDGLSNYTHPTGDGNLHVPATGTSNNGKVLTAGATAGALSWTTVSGGSPTRYITAVFGDGNSTESIASGLTTYIVFPSAGTVSGWRLISSVSCTIVVDVWKAAGAIPTVSDAISGTGDPTLTGATVASGGVTGWSSTAVSSGDIFGFNIASLSGSPTEVSLVLEITP